jgi:hypothetical protein
LVSGGHSGDKNYYHYVLGLLSRFDVTTITPASSVTTAKALKNFAKMYIHTILGRFVTVTLVCTYAHIHTTCVVAQQHLNRYKTRHYLHRYPEGIRSQIFNFGTNDSHGHHKSIQFLSSASEMSGYQNVVIRLNLSFFKKFSTPVGWFYFLLHITITIINCNSSTSDVGGCLLPCLSE